MKKIFCLLTCLSLLFLSQPAGANGKVEYNSDDYVWYVDENYVDEIKDGMTVVLQQGTHRGYSSGKYLGAAKTYKSAVDASCVFEIQTAGKASDGSLLWVLRNVQTQAYIGQGGYTDDVQGAFRCSILRGYFNTDNKRQMMDGASVGNKQQPDADGVAWVFASAEPNSNGNFTYIGYWDAPSFSEYYDTNDWFLYEAGVREKDGYEKFEEAYNALFKNGFDFDKYVVGTDPGCITAEALELVKGAYDKVEQLLENTSATEEDYLSMALMLREAKKAFDEGFCMPEADTYYYFVNQRSQDYLYDTGSNLRCSNGSAGFTLPNPLTPNELKYVWTLVSAGDGGYYLKNLGTQRYMGVQNANSSQFPSTEAPVAKVELPFYANACFLLQDEFGNMAHNDGKYNVVRWQSNDAANQWKIKKAPADQIEAMKEEVEKKRLMMAYGKLLAEAQAVMAEHRYVSDVTFDGKYDKPGLFSTMTGNRTSNTAGSVGGAFDGDLTTFYHTNWNNRNPFDDYDWVQMDLGKDVQQLFVKMTKRSGADGNPEHVFFVSQAEGEELNASWTDSLYSGKVNYRYTSKYPGGEEENSTSVMYLDFGKPVRHLRMGVTKTLANQFYGGKGPCWHLAEFRMYEILGESEKYLLIPQEIRDEFDEQIATAQRTLADSTCVQEDYDRLEAALDAMIKAYPDETLLTDAISEAEKLAGTEGLVGTGIGYFSEEALAELAEVISTIKMETEGKLHSQSQINAYIERLHEAVAAFDSKMILPADGDVLRMEIVASSVDAGGDIAKERHVCVGDADLQANVGWDYTADEISNGRLNALWVAERKDDGLCSLRNIATGRYILTDNIEPGQQLWSTDKAGGLSFETIHRGGQLVVAMKDGQYLEATPTGEIVNTDIAANASVFTLNKVSLAPTVEYTIDLRPGEYQVVSLPFAILPGSAKAYKVLGIKDGCLQLVAYDAAETIPAATPFIVCAAEAETSGHVSVETDALLSGGYNYDTVNLDGLVSAVCTTTLGSGCGILVDNVVKDAVEGCVVSGGTGYFSAIQQTSIDGDAQLRIDGFIGTGIGQVDSSDDDSCLVDVYTLSGVKICTGIHIKDVAAKLSAGVYIVAGKKIVVK